MPWLAAGAVGSSLIGSILGNKTSTTRTLPSALQPLQGDLSGFYSSILQNPSAGMQPMLTSGINQINQNYSSMPDLVSRQLSSRGFGKSGQLGTAMFNVQNARLNDLSSFQSQFNQAVLNRQMQAAAGGNSLVGEGYGATTTTGGPGAGLMTLGNGLSNLATLQMLQQMFNGGSGDSGGSFMPYASASPFTNPGWQSVSSSMIPEAPAAPSYSPDYSAMSA